MDEFKSVNQRRVDAGVATPADYSMFVDKYYEMDPTTDQILFDSTFLRNGMVVLHETNARRVDVAQYDGVNTIMTSATQNLARKWNQWITVSQVHIDHNRTLVKFIGTDPSGVGRIYQVEFTDSWIVREGYDPEDMDDPIIIPREELPRVSEGIIFNPSSKAFLYGGERIELDKETWVEGP